MLAKEDVLLIVYFIVVILLIAGFAIVFFITYQKRKNNILQEKFQAEQNFKAELSSVRLEIQEATLKNVSWELHDNIGQLLAVASMQLNLLNKKVKEENQKGFQEVRNLVANSLAEIRALSRSLNNEVIDYVGLEASVKNEIDRFNRLEVIEGNFSIKGEAFEINQEDSIILFRILQEYFSNVIKYAAATRMDVLFTYNSNALMIEAEENGRGFDAEIENSGSGLINMRSRAEIINTDFILKSSIGNGTSLSLLYPTNQN